MLCAPPGKPSALVLTLSIAAASCAGAQTKGPSGPVQPPVAVMPPPTETEQVAEAAAQRDAQKSWCDYLDALFHHADKSGAKWDKLPACVAARTSASPKMLKKTAECSMTALKAYGGDPFTPEYAKEVSRCGSQALDDLTLTSAELGPFGAVACARAQACGGDFMECQKRLGASLGRRLRRALGALNRQGRADLAACLKDAECADLDAQVTTCLSPIMDRLLWLPD